MRQQTVAELLSSGELELEGREAIDLLVPLVYQELRQMAHRQLLRESAHATLDTTTLVHETYLKLVGDRQTPMRNRRYFFGAAARAMRQVLVDAARRRQSLKRGAGVRPSTFDDARVAAEDLAAEVVDLDEALRRLAVDYPRQADVVECRFFGGLDVEETAEALDLSPRTVKRDWALAKAWLYRELERPAE